MIEQFKKGLTERERCVMIVDEGILDEWFTDVSVMSAADGTFELYARRTTKKKHGGKRAHTQTINVTLSAEAWAHLISAPAFKRPEES